MLHHIADKWLFFILKRPVLSKLLAVMFTVLFFIQITDFANSKFRDFISGFAALSYFLAMTITVVSVVKKHEIIFFKLTSYFVENQEQTATDQEIDFFLLEAEKEGFKSDLEDYINSLNRKPLIKECMVKCMELSKSKGMDA